MKRFLSVIFVILALNANAVFAQNVKVIPEALTKKETENFISINDASLNAFKNLKMKIRTSGFTEDYYNSPQIKDDYHTNDNYYYVAAKSPSLVLIYDKKSKKLEYISVKKANIPCSYAFYEYPSGNLKYVKIWNTKTEWFMFNAKGEYVNYEPYIKLVRRTIADNLKLPNRKIFAHKLGNQEIKPVRVSVSLDNQGNLVDVEFIEKSNIDEINDAISEAIKTSSPFKPFPVTFDNKYITVMFKFNF